MNRQFFNLGQEVVSSDMNYLQSRLERGFLDQVIYELIGRKSNGFFQDGFKVSISDLDELTVKAGLGFQSYADTDSKEPTKKPLVLYVDELLSVVPTDSGTRTDFICVKAQRITFESENRRYKEEFNDNILSEEMVISTRPKAEVIISDEVPEGYMKIAEVLVDNTGAISVTDTRSLLPVCTYSTYGGVDYDAVVGNGDFCTHPDLNSVMNDSNAGNIKNILVVNHPAIDETQVIDQNDVKIEFKRGASLEAGVETGLALEINADGCEIIGGKFDGFNTGIEILVTRKNNLITRCRFVACVSDIADNGDNNELQMNLVEV